ncbi:hypothetical protein JRQ81_015615, partial [Phrynocephalus forsythii]
VPLILHRLKSQGLFDQFRRDCLADVDTKPAYQNLRQRVDNFVSNHLATHTWSPHLNKNQLRNNIRQQVLKSGMLESGIDRIISQVVDPKINHIFRPQVEKAVHEFLTTLNHKEAATSSTAPTEEKPEASVLMQGVSPTTTSASVANDAMSILETITSLNQEASAVRTPTEATSSKTNDRVSKRVISHQTLDSGIERDQNTEDLLDEEKASCNSAEDSCETIANGESLNNLFSSSEEGKTGSKEVNTLINPSKDALQESDELKSKMTDKCDRKPEFPEKGEKRKDKKEKTDKKLDFMKKSVDDVKLREEKASKDRETESIKCSVLEKSSSKRKVNECTKEVFEDSDVDVLSDITVSSVHTSDLSSFEEESEEEVAPSDSTEEGEIFSDDEEEQDEISSKVVAAGASDKKRKPGRHAYVHKPYLYSKYYSDSDDERTVEQRRLSVAREKEERLLRRRRNREKLEKRKQKAVEKTKKLEIGNQGKSVQTLEEPSARGHELKASGASIKDVLKEQRFLEKKVALSRKRKREARHGEEGRKKKCEQPEENLGELKKISETDETSSLKELKAIQGKNEGRRIQGSVQGSVHSTDENKADSKVEKEYKRKAYTSLQVEGICQDTDSQDSKSQFVRADDSSEEPPKQKNVFRNEKLLKKDDLETQSVRNVSKKEARLSKDRNEKERSISEDKLVMKHKYKGDIHKASDDVESLLPVKDLKSDESLLKYSQQSKTFLDDKAEKKNKHRSERKISVNIKDVKNISDHGSKNEENAHKENKKDRPVSIDKLRTEHKSKRLSNDSRPQKESQNISKQHSSASSRKSEIYIEDRHDAGSANVGNTVRQNDVVQKDRRRSKSALEEHSLLKSRHKSQSKQTKVSESELQESFSKKEAGQKLDKDKNTDEADPDKQYKIKNEITVFEENCVEFELEHGVHSVSNSQKDFNPRVKLHSGEKSMKEKPRSDKDVSSFKAERKLSMEGHKNRGSKHSSKDMKKREENNNPEDRSVKQLESNTKIQENELLNDKKPIKRLTSENRKGSLLVQETDTRKEKLSPVTPEASLFPTPQNTGWNGEQSLHPEQNQESREIVLEHGNAQVTKVKESSNNSQQEAKFASAAKDQMDHNSVYKSNQILLTKELQKSSLLNYINPKQKIEHFSPKDIDTPIDTFKQASKDVGSVEEEHYHIITECEKSDKSVLDGSPKLEFQSRTEDSQTLKNIKNTMGPDEESNYPIKNYSTEQAVHHKSMDLDLNKDTRSLNDISKEVPFNLYTPCLKDTILDNQTHTVKKKQHDSFVLCSSIKEDDITSMEFVNKDGKVHLCSKEVIEEKIDPMSTQEAIVKEKNGNANLPNDSFIQGATEFTGVNVDKSVLIKIEEEKRHNVSDGSVNNDKSAIEFKNKAKESHTVSSPKELPLKLVPPNVPEDMNKFSAMERELEGRYSDVGSQSENSVVVSSVGGRSCIDICDFMESDVDIGTSTEGTTGGTVTATSTGLHEGVSKQQREGDAIITCSEEKSKTSLSCTSIEADEGFIVGTWTKNKEGVHFVTEAEESSSVSEGLAVCESSSASTKGNRDVEYIVHDVEEGTKQLVNESGIENDQSMNSLVTEEKDDAVTSAGSEERFMASACGRTSNFDSAATSIGEVESDGAVTSASIEAQDGSAIIENTDEFHSKAVGAEPIKGAEGVVTCTGTESVGSAVCSVTVTDSQEISVVNGIYGEMVNSEEIGPHSDESEVISAESAVTSTGITAEDDPEAAAACTGLEDPNEGFMAALNTEEKYEHATFGTEARAEKNIIETSQGSYDDEGCVTSTGAKEEDEEGEDFVTSTGRCSEESELILTCAETEESERGMVGVETTENRHSSICLFTDQLGTKLDELTSNADKNSVDSMIGLERKKRIGNNSNDTKGIVESSTTRIDMDNENIVVFVKDKEEDSSLIKKCECDIINAATSYNDSLLVVAQEQERAASCLDSRECEGTLVSKKVALVPACANKEDKYEVETISTRMIKLCPTVACSPEDIEEQSPPLAEAVENLSKITEKTTRLLGSEDFCITVPSTAVGNQDGISTKLNKNSAEILKAFEAPVPSITEEEGENLCATVRAEEIITNVGKYSIPLPDVAGGGTGGNQIVHVKEPQDECTVISTSVVEEAEVPISQEGTEDPGQLFPLRSDPPDAALISTHSAEDFKTSVFPEKMHEVHLFSRTKQKLETVANSTTEECEKSTHDVVTPVETSGERNEGSMIFTDIIEECRVVREPTTGRVELAVQSAEESQSAIALVKEGRDCNILDVNVANNKSDQQLVTLSTENPGDSTNARIPDKCDSIYTVAASEESLLNILKETPLAFVSVDVKDGTKTTMSAKQSDCTMLLAQVSNESCSTVLHKEGHRFHQRDPEGILEESSTSQTTDIGSTEVLANTLKSINTKAETCFNSSFGDDSSTEFVMQEKRRQDSRQRDKAPSSPSGILLKKEGDSEYLSADYISHKPALKTERRDLSNRKCLTSLGRNSEDRALAGGTDLCRQHDHNNPGAFSQQTTGYSNDNQEIPNVVEELEESMKMTVDEELQCRNPENNHLYEENQRQRIHKDPQIVHYHEVPCGSSSD